MNWIEIIHVRPYSYQESDQASIAFQQLSLFERLYIYGLKDVRLFRSRTLEEDLIIMLTWHDEKQQNGKSLLGLQLAYAFSEFGQIYHTTWEDKFSLFDDGEER